LCYFVVTIVMAAAFKGLAPWITPARVEDYAQFLRRKADEVRLGLSVNRAAEIVRRPEDPLDSGDCCQKSHDEWLFLNQNRLEIELLRAVEEALRRIQDGAFGTCQECREPISEKRLDAVPWAKFCRRCEEAAGRPPSDI
jgi:DnaK suppressor protein